MYLKALTSYSEPLSLRNNQIFKNFTSQPFTSLQESSVLRVRISGLLEYFLSCVESYLEVLPGEPQPGQHPEPRNGHLVILAPAQTHTGHHRVTDLDKLQLHKPEDTYSFLCNFFWWGLVHVHLILFTYLQTDTAIYWRKTVGYFRTYIFPA